MKNKALNIRTGLYVSLGVLALIGGIYFFSPQKKESSLTTLYTTYKDVGGLQEGNNIHFSGITVGTVQSIEIISNKFVKVTLAIDKETSRFIRKDAIAAIESEGMMGDKVITLSAGSPEAPPISEGDKILSVEPQDMQDMIVSLKQSGLKFDTLLTGLTQMTDSIIHGQGALGELYNTDVMYAKLEGMAASVDSKARKGEKMTRSLANMSSNTKSGVGIFGKVLVEETISDRATSMVDSLRLVSIKISATSRNMVLKSDSIASKDNPLGKFLSDTTMVASINRNVDMLNTTAIKISTSTEKLNHSMFMKLISKKQKNTGGKFK